jgi:hypothetical protein
MDGCRTKFTLAGLIPLLIALAAPAQTITNLHYSGGGNLVFEVLTTNACQVFRTADMIHWQPIGDVCSNNFTFVDNTPRTKTAYLYRLEPVTPPATDSRDE